MGRCHGHARVLEPQGAGKDGWVQSVLREVAHEGILYDLLRLLAGVVDVGPGPPVAPRHVLLPEGLQALEDLGSAQALLRDLHVDSPPCVDVAARGDRSAVPLEFGWGWLDVSPPAALPTIGQSFTLSRVSPHPGSAYPTPHLPRSSSRHRHCGPVAGHVSSWRGVVFSWTSRTSQRPPHSAAHRREANENGGRERVTSHRIILDTDMGTDVDDALALAFALRHPGIEIVAVTTVSGDTALRGRIAAKLLRLDGSADIEVAAGERRPIGGEGRMAGFGPAGHGVLEEGEEPRISQRGGGGGILESP